ncbi:MAG TPA: hypothetical protein VF837_01475 [Patescibacteria group bacterium]
MIKKIFWLTLASLGLLLILVIYNYLAAQKAIRNTQPSVLQTDMVSYPESVIVGSKPIFIWNVQTPNDLTTSFTTIYWSYTSSPSALTVNDSPSAVKYANHTSDYLSGTFKLPDNFDSQLTVEKPGRIFFRSYAKVGDQNLWSKEYSFTVNP